MTPTIPSVILPAGARRVVYGGDQAEYSPLHGLLLDDGKGTVLTEWTPTEDERERLIRGESIRLWIMTFGQPLQPVALEVTSEDEP